MLTTIKIAILSLRLAHPIQHEEAKFQTYAQHRQIALALSIGGETTEGQALAEDFAADLAEGGQR